MNRSLQNTRSKFINDTLNFLWRQWSAIGVAGHARTGDDRVIDPEALILVSTVFARHDPRLLDETADWLYQHGALININRLGNIQKRWDIADTAVLCSMAEILTERSALVKWKSILRNAPTLEPGKEPEPLHISSTPIPPSFWGETDPRFLKHGLIRPPLELRAMSVPPNPHPASNFLFKLRALFGLQSRAEIIAWLLCHDSGHPAAIASDVAYFTKSVQSTLNEMEASGHVISRRTNKKKHFRIVHSQWQFLIQSSQDSDPQFPRWINWPPIFAVLSALYNTLNQPGIENASELFQAVKLRSALENLPVDFTTSSHKTGTDYLHSLLDDFDRLLG
jgi:hypothetical protein